METDLTSAGAVKRTMVQDQLEELPMRQLAGRLLMIPGRSLIPLVALVIIFGTILWGPWVSLILAAAFWYTIGHIV